MTLPPSRWTIPRMRSTILSTRSSARSGRTRKMVSYSRSLLPAAGPPDAGVSACCILPTSRVCRLRAARGITLREISIAVFLGLCLACRVLLRTAVELVHGRAGTIEERGDGGVGGLGHELLEVPLLLDRELRQ